MGQEEALWIIINSKCVDPSAIEKATEILAKEILSIQFRVEAVDESQFIESFNKELSYSLLDENVKDFQYDNLNHHNIYQK